MSRTPESHEASEALRKTVAELRKELREMTAKCQNYAIEAGEAQRS